MATGNNELSVSSELARDARRMKAFSQRLRTRVMEVAEALARTEDSVAATMDRLASSYPDRAEWLNTMSESARKQAVQARQWGKGDPRAAGGPAPHRGPGRR